MSQVVLTVGLMAYNEEKYLDETIESILRQDFDYPIEIIIADNASKDRTGQIAQSFVGKEVTFTDMTAFNPDTEQDGVTVRGFVEELDLKGGTSMLKIGVYDASGQRVDEHFVNFDKVETVGPDLASLF